MKKGILIQCINVSHLSLIGQNGIPIDFFTEPYHKDNWFIDIEKLTTLDEVKSIIKAEMLVLSAESEKRMPPNAFLQSLVGWLPSELPSDDQISEDLPKMIGNSKYMGCVFHAGGKKAYAFLIKKAVKDYGYVYTIT